MNFQDGGLLVRGSYTSKVLCNEECPYLTSQLYPARLDGSIHPIEVGLRMVEEFRRRCKEAVEEDPQRAVAAVSILDYFLHRPKNTNSEISLPSLGYVTRGGVPTT